MSNFRIGEKVVCIHQWQISEEEMEFGVVFPEKGEIYTIREIEFENGKIYLRFEEIINPILGYSNGTDVGEAMFNSIRFRKLDHQFAEDVCAQLIEDAKRETILN